MSTKKTEIPKERSSRKGKEKAIVESDVRAETDENNSNDTKRERSKDRKYAKDSEREEQEEQEETSQEQQEEEEQSTSASEWMAVWDANAQGYYWWNTSTNETTWENPSGYDQTQYNSTAGVSSNPLDTLLDKIDSQAKPTLDDQQAAENMPYEQYFANNNEDDYSYASQAHFNARTGRFTTSQDVERLNPDLFTIENRGTKQMKYYFDVDSYTEEYNRQKQTTSGKKRSLTRKEVEYFKKMKKEKKSKRAREWLLQ
jgi:hypothetical protein